VNSATPEQLRILEHTVGVSNLKRRDWRKCTTLDRCYRNHYVASEGHHAMPQLLELERRGWMTRRDVPIPCGPDSAMFFVTAEGFEVLRAYQRVPPVQRELFAGRSG